MHTGPHYRLSLGLHHMAAVGVAAEWGINSRERRDGCRRPGIKGLALTEMRPVTRRRVRVRAADVLFCPSLPNLHCFSSELLLLSLSLSDAVFFNHCDAALQFYQVCLLFHLMHGRQTLAHGPNLACGKNCIWP